MTAVASIESLVRFHPPTTYKDAHGIDVPQIHLLPEQDPPQECGFFALSALWTGRVSTSGTLQLVGTRQGQRHKGKRYLHCRTLSRLSSRARSRKTSVQRREKTLVDRGPQENGLYNDSVGFVAPRHWNPVRIRLTDAGGLSSHK